MPPTSAQLDFSGQAVGVLPGVDAAVAASPGVGFAMLLGQVMSISMVIAALMLLVYFIWGSIEWISSGGDKSKVEKARVRIGNAVTGILVLSSTVAVIMIVQAFLGISILRFDGIFSPGTGGSGGTGGTGGGTGGTGGGTGGTGTCTPSTIPVNDGAQGRYCTTGGVYSPAMVQCNMPDDHLPYNHYDPCYCLDNGVQVPGLDFDTC